MPLDGSENVFEQPDKLPAERCLLLRFLVQAQNRMCLDGFPQLGKRLHHPGGKDKQIRIYRSPVALGRHALG